MGWGGLIKDNTLQFNFTEDASTNTRLADYLDYNKPHVYFSLPYLDVTVFSIKISCLIWCSRYSSSKG